MRRIEKERRMTRTHIELGALAPSLDTQLREIGITDEKVISRLNLIADRLTVCAIHGMIAPSMIDRGRSKLVKMIGVELRKHQN